MFVLVTGFVEKKSEAYGPFMTEKAANRFFDAKEWPGLVSRKTLQLNYPKVWLILRNDIYQGLTDSLLAACEKFHLDPLMATGHMLIRETFQEMYCWHPADGSKWVVQSFQFTNR